jgi:hypothetical protein
MLQDAAVQKHEKVLEIGTGSGFMTALLAHRAQRVLTLELIHADDDVSGASPWYLDLDLDGWAGDAGASVTRCDAPAGYVASTGDCDDADSAANPGAAEVCDPADVDEDCDGAADDADASTDPSTASRWYPDVDTDGYGDADGALARCDAPPVLPLPIGAMPTGREPPPMPQVYARPSPPPAAALPSVAFRLSALAAPWSGPAPTTKLSERRILHVNTLENTTVISCLSRVRDPSTV